ncbi:hypothetical protein BDV59DRAFT_170970 [Aspergillus ambiguus]|uniref:uncharacterized protein n=1 Tax=Aspergillus ambiguus TaxID=176160 RepID=UPI003CCDA717
MTLYSMISLLLYFLSKISITMATESDYPLSGDELPDMPSVAPDVLSIDGHQFRINYDVPEEITWQLEELYDRDAKYEEVPEHLKAYETELEDTDEEEAKELERLTEGQNGERCSQERIALDILSRDIKLECQGVMLALETFSDVK